MIETQTIEGPGGRKFTIPSTDKYFLDVLKRTVYQGKNVAHLKALALATLPEGSTIRTAIDIGTNLGQSIIEYAQFSKRCIGFEPTPSNYECAMKNLADNVALYLPEGKQEIYPFALSDKEGELEVVCHSLNVGSNFCREVKKKTDKTVTTPVKVLDKIMAERRESDIFDDVDFIKIDVEGYELFVLRGAEDTIQKHRPIIQTEMNNGHLGRAGVTAQQIQDFFTERCYVRTIRTKKGMIIRGAEYKQFKIAGDSFWIPREKIETIKAKGLIHESE